MRPPVLVICDYRLCAFCCAAPLPSGRAWIFYRNRHEAATPFNDGPIFPGCKILVQRDAAFKGSRLRFDSELRRELKGTETRIDTRGRRILGKRAPSSCHQAHRRVTGPTAGIAAQKAITNAFGWRSILSAWRSRDRCESHGARGYNTREVRPRQESETPRKM